METRHSDPATVHDRPATKRAGSTTPTPNQTRVTGARDSTNGGHDENKAQVEFKLRAATARSVAIAGTFNNWDATKTPLKRNGDAWQTRISLPRGRHEYRFVVDGKWQSDPAAEESAPNPYGECNSVVSV